MAAECERRALHAIDDAAVSSFADLARQWRFMAKQADGFVQLAQEKT
jgi:hypothetical protein